MTYDNRLDPVWRQYEVAKDCMRIARKTLEAGHELFLRGTEFAGASYQEAADWIGRSQNELDDFVVLSLWVVFERSVVSLLQDKGRKLLEVRPASLARTLYNKYETDVEYWKIEDSLNLLKGQIDADLIGRAKQTKQYRDWVAHRNPRKPPPAKVDPKTVYSILSEILISVEKLSAPQDGNVNN
jgi:hypothetical protein